MPSSGRLRYTIAKFGATSYGRQMVHPCYYEGCLSAKLHIPVLNCLLVFFSKSGIPKLWCTYPWRYERLPWGVHWRYCVIADLISIIIINGI